MFKFQILSLMILLFSFLLLPLWASFFKNSVERGEMRVGLWEYAAAVHTYAKAEWSFGAHLKFCSSEMAATEKRDTGRTFLLHWTVANYESHRDEILLVDIQHFFSVQCL